MKIREAVEKAISEGYVGIETFAGILPLSDWLEMTSLTKLTYEPGRLVSDWLPSILERGKLERAVFTLV